MQQQGIKQALQIVQENIKKAIQLSQKTNKARLVAVSKTKPLEALQEAYDAGIRHFGENYVDEIVEKSPKLPQDINWHFIGHLQSNKVNKVVVPNLYLLETIDSIKLADKTNNACKKLDNKILKVFVQIKTSNEDSKNGLSEQDCYEVIDHILKNCDNLKFSGIMTIGMAGDMGVFERMYNLRGSIVEKFGLNIEDIELSMGMSGDYEKAIIEGSTNVRVGSTIFGAREYPNKKPQEQQQQQQEENKQ